MKPVKGDKFFRYLIAVFYEGVDKLSNLQFGSQIEIIQKRHHKVGQ